MSTGRARRRKNAGNINSFQMHPTRPFKRALRAFACVSGVVSPSKDAFFVKNCSDAAGSACFFLGRRCAL